MNDVARHLRDALRQLRRSPGFTLVALISLTLGIGVHTAVFSLIDAVLFRPSSCMRNSGQRVSLFSTRGATPAPDNGGLSYPDYRSLDVFVARMAFLRWPLMMSGGETPEPVVWDSGSIFNNVVNPCFDTGGWHVIVFT